MITRIKIDGFKSLLDTELYFGPFTCIAGANAIGKSNFFDALGFLAQLADQVPLVQAAMSVRSENHKHANVKDIFFKSGEHYYPKMSFEVDMLVPETAEDDFGQEAHSSITSLRYTLELQLNESGTDKEPIEIIKEELKPIPLKDIKKQLYFTKSKLWLNSVVKGKKTTPSISTNGKKIKLHQEGNKGRTAEFNAERMPRTLLASVQAESPTAFLARNEMRNWTMLQFEPSALRQPNAISEIKNAKVASNGENLPATLYRLHIQRKEDDVYQQLTNQLKTLVNDVDELSVDLDEKRDLLTLQIKFKDGLTLPAQSLSDGTLRFLGLAIIKEDTESNRLICLEEPENGINPKKITQMVELLKEMATDTNYAVDEYNPLRQVIINSHSPLVVGVVPEESLYLATEREMFNEVLGKKVKYTGFSALAKTWKVDQAKLAATDLGEIQLYLGGFDEIADSLSNETITKTGTRLTVANEPLQNYQKSPRKKTVREHVNQLQLELFPTT